MAAASRSGPMFGATSTTVPAGISRLAQTLVTTGSRAARASARASDPETSPSAR